MGAKLLRVVNSTQTVPIMQPKKRSRLWLIYHSNAIIPLVLRGPYCAPGTCNSLWNDLNHRIKLFCESWDPTFSFESCTVRGILCLKVKISSNSLASGTFILWSIRTSFQHLSMYPSFQKWVKICRSMRFRLSYVKNFKPVFLFGFCGFEYSQYTWTVFLEL